MLERLKRRLGDDGHTERGGVATAPREETRVTEHRETRVSEPPADADTGVRDRPTDEPGRAGRTGVDRDSARAIRARQREEFGGINWGSAFFGWLVAVGMAAILLGLLSAAGAAFGLSEVSGDEAADNAETIGIVGGILLILVLAVAYWCGGYVSGRMSRFDGFRQGVAVWILGLAVTIVLAVAGALFGADYNVLERLNLPRIPVEEGSLTTGAAIALVATLIATLLLAMVGGKAGERYHKKVDRVGYRA